MAMVCTDCLVERVEFAKDGTIKCVCPTYTQKERQQLKLMATQKKDDAGTSIANNEDCNGTFQPNGLPNLKQCNPDWKCYPYAGHQGLSSCTKSQCFPHKSNVICSSGCGITTLTMMLNYFGFSHIKPPNVADYLVAAGYRDDLPRANITAGATCNGVGHRAICNLANAHGLNCEVSATPDVLDNWVNEAPVITHVRHRPGRTCKFTSGGHYIVVVNKMSVDEYTVSDPNSCEKSRTHATLSQLTQDCTFVGVIRMSRRNDTAL